tara:strand:- start:6092 stop:6265 length:174 start_codon:yes stop_codon:yes gene_type:complete
MKRLLFILLFLISACTSYTENDDFNYNSNFNKDMSFEKFKLNLEKYANDSSYPNIDN